MNEDESRCLHDHAFDLGNGSPIRNAKNGAASDPLTLRSQDSQAKRPAVAGGFVTGRLSGVQAVPAQLYILGLFRVDCHIATYHPRSTAHPAHPAPTLQLRQSILYQRLSHLSLLGANSPSLTHGICNAYTSLHSANIIHLFPTICSGMQRFTSAKRCKEV